MAQYHGFTPNASTYTLTFSESIVTHQGMQPTGTRGTTGFSTQQLKEWAKQFDGELVPLHQDHQPEAYLCIFRDGLCRVLDIDADALFEEQKQLKKDTIALMKGRIVNKRARYNLCFADFERIATTSDVSEGKGSVVNFASQPILSDLRYQLGAVFGNECQHLYAEGNYYYDIQKTHIGWHGDTERTKVIGIRLGEDFPLHFRWYYRSNNSKDGLWNYNFTPMNKIQTFTLRHGDVYIMSDKATGHDNVRSNESWMLRHAAGHLDLIK